MKCRTLIILILYVFAPIFFHSMCALSDPIKPFTFEDGITIRELQEIQNLRETRDMLKK